jgi:hypothetical protein
MRNSVLAALAALLLTPAAAAADQVTFGSNLSGTPDVLHDKNLADTLFFNTSAKNSHRSPVSGQILAIRVKGRIVPRSGGVDEGMNLWHSQVLRPNANGSYTVDSSSQHLYFPIGGSADDVHTFVPSVQCLRAGDYVDFNHIGGWNGDPSQPGTRYQIFKRDGDSQLYWYERDQGTNIGATFEPNQQRDTAGNPMTSNGFQPGQPLAEELMMQVVVGTGFDSSRSCEGGLQGQEYDGVQVQKKTFTVYDDGVAGARIGCLSGRGYCAGTLRLELDGVTLGQAPFQISRNVTTNVDVPLTSEGARIVASRGLVDVNVIADSRDDIGQQRQTRGVTTLKAARPSKGFPGTQLRKQSAAVKGGRFSVRATCPLASAGACVGKVSLKSQKRVRGRIVSFGAARFSIEPGKTVRIPVRAPAKGKNALRQVRRVLAIATTVSRDMTGRSVRERSKVVLKHR